MAEITRTSPKFGKEISEINLGRTSPDSIVVHTNQSSKIQPYYKSIMADGDSGGMSSYWCKSQRCPHGLFSFHTNFWLVVSTHLCHFLAHFRSMNPTLEVLGGTIVLERKLKRVRVKNDSCMYKFWDLRVHIYFQTEQACCGPYEMMEICSCNVWSCNFLWKLDRHETVIGIQWND